jgi:hypothetical protein
MKEYPLASKYIMLFLSLALAAGAAHVSDSSDTFFVAPSSRIQSLRAARDAIRQHRSSGGAAKAATVYVAPGTYFMEEPLILEEQDSNTSWRALPGAQSRPRHSGGHILNGTWKAPAEHGAPWVLKIEQKMARFNQLFVGGERAIRAREPEIGSFYQMQAQLPPPNTGVGFVWKDADLAQLAGNEGVDGAELIIYDSWMAGRRNVKSVEVEDKTVLLTAGARISIEPYTNSGSRYYAENYAAACDSPGEWYWDIKANSLLWQPRSDGEDPRMLQFIAPTIAGDLLLLNNTKAVTIHSQTFEHADWSIMRTNTSSGECQAASFLNSAALHLHNSSGCTLSNITVEHVGEYGIWIEAASADNFVEASMVRDSGAGGIRVGTGKPLQNTPDGSDGNSIVNSTFVLGSHVYHEGNGILVQKVSHTKVARCEVAYYSHIGISIGECSAMSECSAISASLSLRTPPHTLFWSALPFLHDLRFRLVLDLQTRSTGHPQHGRGLPLPPLGQRRSLGPRRHLFPWDLAGQCCHR